MDRKRYWAVPIAMAFTLSTVGPRSPVVWAQGQAACDLTGWDWKKNSLGQDPCHVSSILEAACRGLDSFIIRPLRGPDDQYSFPLEDPQQDTNQTAVLTCECDTVTYSLYMACSNCQGGSIYSWTNWTTNCVNVSVAQYPHDIPPGTAVPHWAFYNITSLPNQTYDDVVAMAIGRDPEATPKPTSGPGKKNNTGAIAGGVVGGTVLLVLVLVVVFIIRRRKRGGRHQPPHPQETSEYSDGQPKFPDLSPTTADFSRNTYYDPDDPTTFPPPMDEFENPETHVDGHTTPSQRPSITGM